MTKTKKQHQKWWRTLTPEEQNAYVEKVVQAKSIKRRQRTLKIMKKYGSKYKCSECFHGKIKCCTDFLPNGCEYFYNPNYSNNNQGIKIRDTLLTFR